MIGPQFEIFRKELVTFSDERLEDQPKEVLLGVIYSLWAKLEKERAVQEALKETMNTFLAAQRKGRTDSRPLSEYDRITE